MLDESTRNTVISQGAAILSESKAALDRVSAESAADRPDGPTAAQLQQSLELLADRFNSLETNPFPIGWAQFPGCSANSTDPRCASKDAQTILTWIFGCLLTACLAGLGAPFWYDAVSGLMSVAQRSRSSSAPAAAPPAEPAPTREPPSPPPPPADDAADPDNTEARRTAGQ